MPGYSRDAGPLGLAGATIYLPTRRSARALATTIAAQVGTTAFLPRIRALGALDGDDILDEAALTGDPDVAIPPAIDPIARRMILMRLILRWSESVRHALVTVDPAGRRETLEAEAFLVATTAADAWHLAGELGGLLDEMTADGVDWSAVKPLGTDLFDRYWAVTLDFLTIAVEQWPAILAAMGLIDPAVRQTRLIEAEIRRLERVGAGAGPTVVVGSTGANRATNRLMAAIARLPQGAVVLPGLDQNLDAASWDEIDALSFDAGAAAGHAQATLRQLLPVLGVTRETVATLGTPAPALAARNRFVTEALRPADTTDVWQRLTAEPGALDREAALGGVTVIEAADEREEALALALVLREALERDGTATLVTPDRALARRVREDLARWDIVIDDSGGETLAETRAGALARLTMEAARQDLAPAAVLALLTHPAVRLGRTRPALAALAGTLERGVLRTTVRAGALGDPETLVAAARARVAGPHVPRALRGIAEADFDAVEALLVELKAVLAPLRDGRQPLPAWIAAHDAAMTALAMTDTGGFALRGPDANALTTLFDGLAEAADPAIGLDAAGYAALFERMIAEVPVRGPERSHPRLKILGLLEARLLSTDLILLGGLDETVWPPQVRTDCFLNRPMRATLGLIPPERRIGQSAHDFTMALGQPEVVISRARKRGGSPTVPSRFLQRMAALAGDEPWKQCRARGAIYLEIARRLDQPDRPAPPLPRPNPKPPVALRPTSLSVTRIETLRRDPYAVFADRVLRLSPLDPVAGALGPREWGTTFHDVLAAFTALYPTGALPTEAEDLLREQTRAAFAGMMDEPAFRAFMAPRIDNWVTAFLAWETTRRAPGTRVLVEERGSLDVPLRDGSVFTLTAHADRIEVAAGGGVRIVDYKTGHVPSKKEVQVGFAPQLTLEAALAERQGYAALGPGAVVGEALYAGFGSGAAVDETRLAWKDRAFQDVVADHFDGLVTLLSDFRDPDRGYLARPYPQFLSRHGDYDHLSRVKEWSTNGGPESDA